MATAIAKGTGELSAPLTRPLWALNWALILGPFVALIVGVGIFWGWGVNLWHIIWMIATYIIIAPGATVGYHRYFTHQSFKMDNRGKFWLGFLALMTVEGPILKWVPEHKFHHKYSDTDIDLHSPMRGFLHAHILWFFKGRTADPRIWAPHIVKDPVVLKLDRLFPAIVLFSIVGLPIVLGALPGIFRLNPVEILVGGFQGFIWIGLVRMMLIHHVTWSVNSICHIYGTRNFKTPNNDTSGDVWWLWLFSLGESWHRFHHAIQASALHGPNAKVDPSFRIIEFLEKRGIAWDVRRPTPEQIAKVRVPAA